MELEKRISMYEEIGKHIARLLYKYDCVIVPNFGAFLKHYQSADLNLLTGAIVPPTKTLSFNTALNHNDGLLATAISQSDSIAYADALDYIALFVRYWNQDLSLQGILSIHKVGRFISDAQGRVQFLSENHNYNDEAYLLPILYKMPLLQSVPPLKAEEPIVELESQRIDRRPAAPTRPLPPPKHRIKRWENAIVAAALLSTSVVLLYLLSPTSPAEVADTKPQTPLVNTASIIPALPPAAAPANILPEVKPAFLPEKNVETPVIESKKAAIKEISVKNTDRKVTKVVPKVVPDLKKAVIAPVERRTVQLGVYKSPANVAALMLHAKNNNDVLFTKINAKGLTIVTLSVQVENNQIDQKIAELSRIYGVKPIIK